MFESNVTKKFEKYFDKVRLLVLSTSSVRNVVIRQHGRGDRWIRVCGWWSTPCCPRPSDDRSNNHPALAASPICLSTLLAPADMADVNSLQPSWERGESEKCGVSGRDARGGIGRTVVSYVIPICAPQNAKKRSHSIKNINIASESTRLQRSDEKNKKSYDIEKKEKALKSLKNDLICVLCIKV